MGTHHHIFIHVLAIIAVAVISSCAPGEKGKKSAEVRTMHFPVIQAPSMMEDGEKIEYLAEHFWTAYLEKGNSLATDSTVLGGVPKEEVEQAVSNYIMLLSNMPLDKASKTVAGFTRALEKCREADTSSVLSGELSALFARYIYDPNSPLRDEDLYTPFAAVLSSCTSLDPAERASYAEDVRLTSLNRRGTKAADFSFVDRKGRRYTLYGIKAERTILFFSNPGCTACKEIIEALDSEPVVVAMIDEGTLAVLNIYIDEEIADWMSYMPIYPEKWYNGYDYNHMIRDEELYNVRAIPSLYLLDADKTVLLKDVTTERLLNNL